VASHGALNCIAGPVHSQGPDPRCRSPLYNPQSHGDVGRVARRRPSDGGETRVSGGSAHPIHEERKLEVDAPPRSRFKGYARYLVQDLMIRPHVTCFRRQCWQTPDGKTVMAPLPAGIDGHFGPELRRFVLAPLLTPKANFRRVPRLSTDPLRCPGAKTISCAFRAEALLPPSTSGNASIEEWRELIERGLPFDKVAALRAETGTGGRSCAAIRGSPKPPLAVIEGEATGQYNRPPSRR